MNNVLIEFIANKGEHIVQSENVFKTLIVRDGSCKNECILPIAIWDVDHFWFEAICVIAFVTSVTQQQLIFIFTGRTKLAIL